MRRKRARGDCRAGSPAAPFVSRRHPRRPRRASRRPWPPGTRGWPLRIRARRTRRNRGRVWRTGDRRRDDALHQRDRHVRGGGDGMARDGLRLSDLVRSRKRKKWPMDPSGEFDTENKTSEPGRREILPGAHFSAFTECGTCFSAFLVLHAFSRHIGISAPAIRGWLDRQKTVGPPEEDVLSYDKESAAFRDKSGFWGCRHGIARRPKRLRGKTVPGAEQSQNAR